MGRLHRLSAALTKSRPHRRGAWFAGLAASSLERMFRLGDLSRFDERVPFSATLKPGGNARDLDN